MSSTRREALRALVAELLAESEKELEGELRDDTSLVASGLLDSLALLQIADWVAEELDGELDLARTNIRAEWDTLEAILGFVERRS